MSNFSTASKVLSTIMQGDAVENARSLNRKKILDAANCEPPLTKEEAKKIGIKINVNWGEFAKLLSDAKKQLVSAFTSNQYYYTVELPRAPKEHQTEWGSFITQEINEPLQRGTTFYMLHDARWSSVIKNGIGAMMWTSADGWLPRFVPLSDLRIPSDTELSFQNLNWFSRRIPYTITELIKQAFNKNQNNFWDKKSVAQILKNYKELNVTDAGNNYNWETDWEKLSSILKQDGSLSGGDAMPTIPLYHFYFEDEGKWYMHVVPETGTVRGADQNNFLWKSPHAIASSWKELIHCQFGDLSFDDPPKFHSVRGLGFILLEPTFYSNITRCRLLQHVHDNLNILLRISDPSEKARAAIQEFQNLGVLRSGVSIVPQNERHQIQFNLVEMVMAQLRQLQSEASSSYTQQADSGTQKEQTAFETRVKAEQVNAMTSGIVLRATAFEAEAGLEICRRFCLKNSQDPDIQTFQSRCIKAGIPQEWLDVKQWIVRPMVPIGMGNPTIAQAAISQLQGLAPKLSPDAQSEINHEAVLVMTHDARKAARWAPISHKPTQSDATREAIGLFATLLISAPGAVPPPQNNYIDQIEALIPLLAGQVMLYTQRNNMATVDESRGLNNVLNYIGKAVQSLGQDQAQKERVKKYTDAIAKIGNEIKALTQRGLEAEKAQTQQGQNSQVAESAARMQVEQAEAAQRMAHKEREHQADQRRKDMAARAEQRRKDSSAYASIEHGRFQALAQAHNTRINTQPKENEE